MSRPVVRAGVAAAVLSVFTAGLVLAVPAILPSWQVAWLFKPLLGVEVRPLQAEWLGLASGPGLAVSLALDCTAIVAAAFYLDHCVINQPMWAVVGGWGLLFSGLVTSTLQEVVGASRTTFIDIDHMLWPLGLVPVVFGATVILASWWRAPEFFSPHMSRWTVLALVPAIAIVAFGERIGASQTAIFALTAVIGLTALTGGEWIAGRSSAQSSCEPDLT